MIFTTRILINGNNCGFHDYSWLHIPIYTQMVINLAISVLTGSLGSSKLLKVGPCRLVPYDKMSFGFIVVVIINASCIIAKGLVLAYALLFGFEGLFVNANHVIGTHTIVLWIVICILPHIFFVSRKVLLIIQIC